MAWIAAPKPARNDGTPLPGIGERSKVMAYPVSCGTEHPADRRSQQLAVRRNHGVDRHGIQQRWTVCQLLD
jgi:hypothetical protein